MSTVLKASYFNYVAVCLGVAGQSEKKHENRKSGALYIACTIDRNNIDSDLSRQVADGGLVLTVSDGKRFTWKFCLTCYKR